jgi:hypothetical protein
VRKFKGSLIKSGWPKAVEIKANHLHWANHDSRIPASYKYKTSLDEPVVSFLGKLAAQPIEIDVIIVNKARINADLRTLPHGVLYNYYSRLILIERITKYDEACLFIDRTSKQTHSLKRFDEYIYTEALLAKGRAMNFTIIHGDSNRIRGISAVDFISWAVSRKYEYADNSFWRIFQDKVVHHVEYLF